MFVTINHTPSTFFSETSPLRILDDKKNMFYFHPNNEKNITFNLPKGKYYCADRIFRQNFVPYNYSFKGFSKEELKAFDIITCRNKNKATIFPDERKIFVDYEISKHKYKPLKVFAMGHELSHCHEEGRNLICDSNKINWCDINSANWMLANGYNPSQIQLSMKVLLGDNIRTNCTEGHMNLKRR